MPFRQRALCISALFLGSLSSFNFAEEPSLPQQFEYRLQLVSQEGEEKNRLHQLFSLYWEWHMDEHPDEAVYLGYPGQLDRWSSLSLDTFAHRQDFIDRLLECLNGIDPAGLEEEDLISHQILVKILSEEQEKFKFNEHFLLLNQMHGIHHHAAMIMELMPAQTLQDYGNILSRLKQLPLLFEQATQLLTKGLEVGVTPPMATLKPVPQQILNQIPETALSSPLLKSFVQFTSSIDPDSQALLLEQAEDIYEAEVRPAVNQFYDFIVKTYIPGCRSSIAFSDLPQGSEWYASKVREMTTTELTPTEIHAIGLKEVERIYQEMHAIMESTGFKDDFKAFLHFLQTDPQFFYSTSQELLKGYRDLTRLIEAQLPRLFSKRPLLPFEVVPVPAYSEESQIAAYYCPGSIAHKRPGYFFVNTSYPTTRPKWEMEPLALHEAVPGHHLQLTLAQELEHLPEFRKNCHFTAYIEGWGLYSEGLGEEFGLYRDPYSKFGRLNCEMLRAIRLVVDTGMHALGWSREEAIEYFKQYVGMSEHEIETEVDRYLVMPAQALAYKIGELKINEMRRFAAQALEESFDTRLFHDEWLKHGTVPLDIAEQAIKKWVEKLQAASAH